MRATTEPSWDCVKAMSVAELARIEPGQLNHLIEAEVEIERDEVGAADERQPHTLSRFARIKDEQFRDLGWAVVRGPLSAAQRQFLARLRRRYRILGVASYMDFPAPQPGDPTDYPALAEGWCHCFRAPERYGLGGRPHLLLAESDFTDPETINFDNLQLDPGEAKQFDFVYVGTSARSHDKNWALARECLPLLCNEMGLRGAMFGRDDVSDLPTCAKLSVFGKVPWLVSLLLMHRSRMLFVPSVRDASPRVLGEAMCLDLPLLVNRHIFGGWHYVNEATGAYFESPADVAAGALHCLRAPGLSPRRWFVEHHGWERAGSRLHRFLRSLDPSLPPAAGAFIVNDL